MNYQDKIEAMLEMVQKAPRYTGGEMNTAIKPWEEAKLHFAFCFPDTYEVGMSHLGMKILYGAINAQPDMLCERVFMPWVDMKTLMEEENVPLFSLENRRALNEFDVVGFTLQYEMSYTNVLAMLKLGNIPLLREERKEEMPIMTLGDTSLVYNTDWKCAIENINLLDLAEAAAKSAKFREETRGHMYRVDFPEKDDENWLCNVRNFYKDGEITCEKADVVTV